MTEPSGVVDRALSLVKELRAEGASMTLSELSRRTGLAKSTAHRMLTTLTSAGLVERIGYRYRTSAFLTIGTPPGGLDTHVLAPHVSDLYVRTRQTCGVAVLSGTDVVFSHRVYGHDSVRMPSDDTGREHAHTTAAGRLLLAFQPTVVRRVVRAHRLDGTTATELSIELDRIRRARFAVGTVGTEALCLAVPVLGADRTPVAALTLRGRRSRFDPKAALHWMRAVAETAARDLVKVHPTAEAA
jgi:IclR family KDG regulon transcriptional repressor